MVLPNGRDALQPPLKGKPFDRPRLSFVIISCICDGRIHRSHENNYRDRIH